MDSLCGLMADYSNMTAFHEYNADRFADDCEIGKPIVPLSPFYTFMFAWQFTGVAANGGWAHALRCYADELDLIKSMLKNIGAVQLSSHVNECQCLVDRIMNDETAPDDRGNAHDKIDEKITLEYDHLDPLIETYFDTHYDKSRLT